MYNCSAKISKYLESAFKIDYVYEKVQHKIKIYIFILNLWNFLFFSKLHKQKRSFFHQWAGFAASVGLAWASCPWTSLLATEYLLGFCFSNSAGSSLKVFLNLWYGGPQVLNK